MTKDTFADEKNIEDVVDEKTHTIVVLTLMVLISSMSMFVKDLTIVYSIIAAFSESFINFILAGLFLICTENTKRKGLLQKDNKNGTEESKKETMNYYGKISIGVFLFIFGLFHFAISVMQTIKKIDK